MRGMTSKTTKTSSISNLRRVPIMIALLIGAFISILNETLLSNALPELVKQFHVTEGTIQWLTTAYMLTMGVLVPITAVLQQWFTTRKLFFTSLVTFLLGTLLAGFSVGFEWLLLGRILQAVGAGMILPIMMNTVLIIFPPHKRGMVMGLTGLVIMFAPATGPTLSGVLIAHMSWRWLFFIVVPLTLIALLIGYLFLRNVTEITKPKIDVFSIVLSTIGFGGVVYSFGISGDMGWTLRVFLILAISLLALLWFVLRQLRIPNPLLDLTVFRYPMFALGTVIFFVLMMNMFSTIILLPLLLQGLLFATVLKSGLILLPGSILNGAMSPIAGKLFDKYGAKLVMVPGFVLIAVAMWLLSGVTSETSTAMIIVVHSLTFIGIALAMMPSQTMGLNHLPKAQYADGAAIFNTIQQIAGAIGSSLFISRMSASRGEYISASTNPLSQVELTNALHVGLSDAFQLGLIVACIGVALSLAIRRNSNQANKGNRKATPNHL